MKSFFLLIERDTRGLKMGIREIFPMFELTLDGLEKAVGYMMRKN
jgi:hypothetical protein